MKVAEKKRCIEPEHDGLSIGRQCELIGLARCSYYRIISNGHESPENLALMRRIDEEYTKHPFYGTRQMRNYLCRQGYKINRKRVQRLMRKMGLQSIAPKPNTSKPKHKHKIYPYLLGGIDVTFPNQVWCSDITYIPMASGFVYLTAVMDWHSRYVLSWEISVTMDSEFCVSALERALRCYDHPTIFNTDQGAQYTGIEFTGTLKAHDIKISMDGKGRAIDNIFIERLWRSVKYEEVYLNEYQSVEQLRKALKIYFEFYNHQRPHQSFNGQTPAEIYFNQVKMELAA
jgi:putative transposase